MEATVDKLEAMFQKAESDLDLIHRKLEHECAAKCENATLDEANQVKLLERVSEIKDEYQTIMDDAKEIQKAQAEAMLFFKDSLSSACQALVKLQVNSGMQIEKPEELEKVEQLLDLNIQDFNLPSEQKPESSSCEPENVPNTRTQDATEVRCDPPQATSSRPNVEQIELSPYELRCCSASFIEITEKEFNTVSSLIRGRVKLSEVNSTYQILWQYCKESEDCHPLTPTDMHKMGLRVTGKTGEAKLRVLRALKLLSISKKGDVKLL